MLPKENTVSIETFTQLLKEKPNETVIIDVRPPVQFGIVSLPGSINLPYRRIEREQEARDQIIDLSKQKEIVFIMCRRGNDSREATRILIDKCQLKNVVNVEKGIGGYS